MGRVYATTDLHGHGDLWDQIKEFLKEDDKLVFLGDAIDRGPDGVRIMAELLSDSRVIYIKGNHEWLASEDDNLAFWLKKENGGIPTFRVLMSLDEADRTLLKNEVKKLHCCAEYTNSIGQRIFLCHAGWDMVDQEADILQDREHFIQPWPKDCEYDILIHGHTPVGLLKYLLCNNPEDISNNKIMYYCDNHKIDIDVGTNTTGTAALLDLDTFDVHYFYNKNCKEIKELL